MSLVGAPACATTCPAATIIGGSFQAGVGYCTLGEGGCPEPGVGEACLGSTPGGFSVQSDVFLDQVQTDAFGDMPATSIFRGLGARVHLWCHGLVNDAAACI